MKTKVLLTMGAMMAFAISVMAGPVSKAEALAQARSFMQSKGIHLAGDLAVMSGPKRAMASRDESSCYYIFNNGQNGGFVIVSGDDRTRDILGYSDTGAMDMDNLPDNVRYMLDCFESEINELDKLGVERSAPRRSYGETATTNPVLPLVTCKWSQDKPFNNSCPTVNSTPTYAGCVAVATAQLVYFYRDRLPAKTPAKIPAYTTSGGISVKEVAAGTAFNWTKMYDEYDGTQTSAQLSAVANLILYVGKALKSNYSTSATSASMSSIKSALVNYFTFSPNTSFVSRTSYTSEKWESMVLGELEENRPVMYNGVSTKDNHAFLIDGYDGRGLFHVNWGWKGQYDGYFALSVLNPYDAGGIDAASGPQSYTLQQNAYFNLQPENGYSYTEGPAELTSTISSVSSNVVNVVYKNLSSKDAKFKCGLGYLDSDGYVNKLMENTEETTVAAGSSMGTVSYTLKAADFKPASGTTAERKLYPIFLLNGEEEWTQCPNTSSNYVQVKYNSGSITSSLVAMTASLKATNFVFTGSCTKSVAQPVNFKLTNSGDKDYTGYVYLFASTTSTKGSVRSKVRVILPKGESYNAALSFTPATASSAGTSYNVWISTDASGEKVIGSSKVTITSKTPTKSLKVLSVTLDYVSSASKYKIYSDAVKGVAKVENLSAFNYNDVVLIWLMRKKVGSGSWVGYKYEKYNVIIPAGETKDFNFDFGVQSKDYTYGFAFYYAGGSTRLTNGLLTGYSLNDGVLYFTGDGTSIAEEVTSTITVGEDVAAVSLAGVASSITKVVPNSNPNTLYIFEEGETVPSGLSGKNIVKGSSASSIKLQDGYDFYSPVTFVADNITYSRTPQIGATGQGDGWESLVVPFNVDKLMYSSYQLGWFTSDDDTGKNLWVKQFSGIKGYSTVCFDYTDKIVANRPYIMAVPSNHWGEAYNLTGKKLDFKASNATVLKDASLLTGSKVYNYRGTYYTKKVANIYYLDSRGQKFIQGTATVKPFHCYFISAADGSDDDYGNMDIVTSVKGIMIPFASENEDVSVYNISGMKVGTTKVVDGRISLDELPKGIYIINGHKFIK